MSLARLFSRASLGVEAPLVTVEAHLSPGLPAFNIVGLPETTVKESRDRVRSAILNAGFEFPARRITVNLAPADLPKEGGRFDLPIALGVLAASGQLPAPALAAHEFIGELALNGELRAVRGVLPAAVAARTAGRSLFVPEGNAAEAALGHDAGVLAASHLLRVAGHLSGQTPLLPQAGGIAPGATDYGLDLADVKGQQQARRALEIAAAGGHSLLMLGPPGTGKTLLASRLPTILPPMSQVEAMESAAVLSVSGGGFEVRRWGLRPFRSPHHTASAVALVGGGGNPRPGEISLAHHGVLFLDELPEFDRQVLEVLREPLESGHITISRAARQADFPAAFQLVAAMNPCPCGYLGDPSGRCRCTAEQVAKYLGRLSGPLLDRIDMHVEVPRLPREVMQAQAQGEASAWVRERVCAARERQQARQGRPNARLAGREIDHLCAPDAEGKRLLEQAIERLGFSARAYHRVLKLARSIADLAASEGLHAVHIAEAIGLRRLDRRT